MHDIVEEIDRESQIINDLLSLVRMDKTAAGLNLAPQNINELVEHVLRRLKPIAEEKNIELVLEAAVKPSPLILIALLWQRLTR